jgi:ribosomal protein S18 acetylase RimI-like enzyme
VDIWVDPAYRRMGHGRALRDYAVEWIGRQGVVAGATVWGEHPAGPVLFPYPVRSQRMVKKLDRTPVLAEGLRARALTEEEFQAWHEAEIRGYASDMVDSGSMPAERALEEAARQSHALLSDGLATPGHSWALIEAEGHAVATVWVGHLNYPGLSWVYGVESDPARRGRGYGRAAMLAGEGLALAAGNPALGLNVFGHNTIATSLYNSLGYTLLEQSRHL